MTLANMNDEQLHLQMGRLAEREREVLSEVILCIQEVDRRRLYLRLGFASTFAYLTEGHKYSSGAAQRRIDAARLLRVSPVMHEKLAQGELTLKHISVVAQGVREVTKRGEKVSEAVKSQLLEEVCGQPELSAQVQVARRLGLEVKQSFKQRRQQDESVRIEMTLSKGEMECVEKAKQLLSHKHPHLDVKELLMVLTQELIHKKDPARERKVRNTTATVAVEVGMKPEPKAQPHAATRRQIFQRDKCCQWRNPTTGRQCGSKHQLQVDHVQARWQGGTNDKENLQLLCRKHNVEKYRLERSAVPPTSLT